MEWQEMRAVARGFAYALLEANPFLHEITNVTEMDTASVIATMFRNQTSEFWHCIHRKWYVEGPHVGLRIVSLEDVDDAIANTLAWLKWYQRGGHKQGDETPEEDRIPMPEWGKDYR